MREVVDRYAIAVEELDPSWVTLSRTDLALFPKEQDQLVLTFRPPEGAPAGRYEVPVVVASLDSASESTTVTLVLEVVAEHALELALRPQRQTGVSEGLFRVQLKNAGNADLTVHFEATDPDEGCQYAFDPPQVVVAAGQEAQVQLTVRSKRALGSEQPRTFLFTVTARPLEAARLVRQVSGEWMQVPPALEVVLVPERPSSVKEGVFGLQVTNQGPAELAVQLQAGDPEQACLYVLEPSSLVIPPEGQGTAQLRVRPKTGLAEGQNRTFGFAVAVQVAGSSTVSREVQGQWEQVPPTLNLALNPPRQGGATAGLFLVSLSNPGDAELTVGLTAADSQGGLYTFEPSQVVVPAGGRSQVRLTARSPLPPDSRQSRTYAFTVTVRAVEAPSLIRQVQGEWVQSVQPAPPPAASPQPVTPPAPARPAPSRPRFGLTVALMVGLLVPVALGSVFTAVSAIESLRDSLDHALADALGYAIMAVVWLAGMALIAVIARAVWQGPRFWPFFVTTVVGWSVAALGGFLAGNAIESAPGDGGMLPLIVAVLIWLGGIVGSIFLGRAIARVGK
ncbi:MAG: hypothetical protein JW900_09435, partial [Anaerolineae bacterium]|nr:hypothetical protein [Anaerolineae bacterium]